jgi:hypothetical protein
LPMLICWPCLVVRPAFMMKRFDAMSAVRASDSGRKS